MKKYLEISMEIVLIGILFILYLSFENTNFSGTQSGILPNPQLTPGAVNSQVTQSNIQSTICKSGWAATIRPPSSYTTALKYKQFLEYGYTNVKTKQSSSQISKFYEEDHLISLELGGHPTDPKNLWPESYLTTPNARDKDQVENYLKKQVCSGEITLKEAQKIISTDWTKVKINTFGAVDNSVDLDDE